VEDRDPPLEQEVKKSPFDKLFRARLNEEAYLAEEAALLAKGKEVPRVRRKGPKSMFRESSHNM
jgi:hypothetical protein